MSITFHCDQALTRRKEREGRFILVHGLSRRGPSGWGKCAQRQLHGNTSGRLLAHRQRSGCRMRLVPVLRSLSPIAWFIPSILQAMGWCHLHAEWVFPTQPMVSDTSAQTYLDVLLNLLHDSKSNHIAMKINHLSSSISSSGFPAWKFSLNTPHLHLPSHVCLCFGC